MSEQRQFVPVAGLLAICGMSAYMVVQLDAQARQAVRDLSTAGTAEVRDARGQVILRGNFEAPIEQDDDIERKATLASTGVDADASGVAEIELSKDHAAAQELEFSIRQVEAGAVFTFFIDGAEVGTATANRRGRAGLEVDMPRAATPADL